MDRGRPRATTVIPLPRDGVVFVSINYRLGAMGFLDAGAVFADRTPGTGNYGIADQVAALEWVRDNIAGFGGDPSNVTVLGVSAGANYTQSLTVCPPARGLFKRAISESAGGITLFGLPRHVTGSVTRAYLEKLGVTDEAALASLRPEQLLDAQAALLKSIQAGELKDAVGDLTLPFYPVIGTDYQPWSVIEADARGEASDIDLILGTNLHEMTLFKLLGEMTGGSSISPRALAPRDWEAPIREVYVDTEPDASDERIDATVEGDRMFRIPNMRAAEARVSGGGRTWVYQFAWETPVFDGRLGAAHGLETPFVFDDMTSGIGQFLLGGIGPVGTGEGDARCVDRLRSGREPRHRRVPGVARVRPRPAVCCRLRLQVPSGVRPRSRAPARMGGGRHRSRPSSRENLKPWRLVRQCSDAPTIGPRTCRPFGDSVAMIQRAMRSLASECIRRLRRADTDLHPPQDSR